MPQISTKKEKRMITLHGGIEIVQPGVGNGAIYGA